MSQHHDPHHHAQNGTQRPTNAPPASAFAAYTQPAHFAHGAPALPSSSHTADARQPEAGLSPYDDPKSLLKVIPVANYAPTARVASHIAPHTQTFLPPRSSASLYPEHAQSFQRMDNPSTPEDWASRQYAQQRLMQLLQNAGPMHGADLQPFPTGVTVAPPHHPPTQPLPLSYAMLPQYISQASANPQAHFQPLQSPSTYGPPAPGEFERMVSDAVARAEAPAAEAPLPPPAEKEGTRSRESTARGSATPSINRAMSEVFIDQSPDPLSLPGPSPSKRHKFYHGVGTGTGNTSPTSGRHGGGTSGSGSSSLSSLGGPSRPRAKLPEEWLSPSKPRSRVVVEIPVRRMSVSSRSSSRMHVDDDESEDELDWGEGKAEKDGDWAGSARFRSPSPGAYGAYSAANRVGTKSVRTGEKDLRTARQKFNSLIEDVFEASDSLPAEPTAEHLAQSRFFDRLAKDGATPLIAPDTVDKISRYVTRLHSGKRARKSASAEDAWDEEALKRVFRLLERVMREAEDSAPFPADMRPAVGDTGKKGKKTRKGKTSKSPDVEMEDGSLGAQEANDGLSEEVKTKGDEVLGNMASAAAAVECMLIILDGEDLSKPLYSEDLLSLAVGLIRDQMSKVIFPITEGMAGDKIASRYLSYLVQAENTARQGKGLKMATFFEHPALSVVAQRTAAALPHLSSLISRPDISFSDSLVIQTVYLAISPLFVSEPAQKRSAGKSSGRSGWSVMKSLRLEALGCLRGAFAKYNEQRQWIIEEILSSLVKLPDQKAQSKFQVSDGTTMSTISALLLQLIQASAIGVSLRIKKLRASAIEVEMGGKEGAKEQAKAEETRLCTEVTESCYRSARVVAAYLLQKSGQSKASKSTLDTDFKGILETLVEDLLAGLYRPEWPGAAMYLTVFSKLFIATLDDTSTSAETTIMKNIALDHLGSIGARLRGVHVLKQDEAPLMSLDQVIASGHSGAATALINAHKTVHGYLASASQDDSMYTSALDLSLTHWVAELHSAIEKAQSVVQKLSEEKTEDAQDEKARLEEVLAVLRSTLVDVWSSEENLFGVSDPKQADAARDASVRISRLRPLQSAFDPILHALLAGMEMPAVALRSKALKALSSVALIDPDILSLPHVRAAFENRLSDASPAVRDSALDLVGKYVVQKPELAEEYYPQIASRVTDSGLGVRKKVIKLLKEIFGKTKSNEIRVDSCCKMVEMVDDSDDGIQEAAVKSLVEMLYASSTSATAALFVDIVGQYRNATSMLEKALDAVAALDAGTQAGRTSATVDALVQRLIDATEQVEFDSVSHIRAISLLCASKPDLIDPHKAGVLLNYLRPASNSDEQSSNELLLRTFRLSIPFMPRTASSFATELSAKLKPMVGKPSGGFSAVKETIGCLCAVVQYLTKDYSQLLTILRACLNNIGKIKAVLAQRTLPPQTAQALGLTMYIVALIAEHINLDAVAEEDGTVQTELSKLIKGPSLSHHLYDLVLDFTSLNVPQAAPILSLGCLFRSYPDLVLMEESGEWMDKVFASNDNENQARLLGVIYEFLAGEARKRLVAGQQSKDITALIGNTADITESGLSTSIVQRNFEHIMKGARSHHAGTQNAALDILGFTVNQGLYHPIQCMPILISLETNENEHLAERALELHSTLHHKHSGLVNVRFLDFARASYDYQRTITSEVSGHRDGRALLSGWYALVSEKRAWRMDFIRALTRGFEYDSSTTTAADVGFALYLADNLCAFEYKLQEEVMLAVQHLSTIVSMCTPLVSTLEKAVVHAEDEQEPLEGKMASIAGADESAKDEVQALPLINASLIVSIALLAKDFLIGLYSLTEDKCLKQNTTKKSVTGDKPAQRRNQAVLETGRLTLVRGVETVRDFREQQTVFNLLIMEDGHVDVASDVSL